LADELANELGYSDITSVGSFAHYTVKADALAVVKIWSAAIAAAGIDDERPG
jgi:hypothetical protein